MTIRDAYRDYQTLADEVGRPYLSPPRFVRQYDTHRLAWLKDKAAEPDTEYVNLMIGVFRRRVERTGNLSNGIDLTTLPTNETFYLLRNVSPDFEGGILRSPCKPITEDQWSLVMNDPMKRPTDYFPRYRRLGNLIYIQSATTPVKVTIDFIIKPKTPELSQNTSSELQEDTLAVREILERIVARQDLTVENYNRHQLTAAGQAQRESNL